MNRYEFDRLKEKFMFWLVWKFPRYLVYWAAIRLMSYATVGKWGNTDPNNLTVMKALERWNES